MLLTPSLHFSPNFSWSFSSVFPLKKIQRDGESRNLFLLWEGVQGLLLPSSLVLTLESRWTPEPKKHFYAALSVSEALAEVSNMCETTSPSVHAALFNDVPPRGPSSTKHDRHHLWVWLPSVTDSLRVKNKPSSVTTVAPCCSALRAILFTWGFQLFLFVICLNPSCVHSNS